MAAKEVESELDDEDVSDVVQVNYELDAQYLVEFQAAAGDLSSHEAEDFHHQEKLFDIQCI